MSFVIVGVHVTNLGYLKDGFSGFTEISNGGINNSNNIIVKLDIAIIILETND